MPNSPDQSRDDGYGVIQGIDPHDTSDDSSSAGSGSDDDPSTVPRGMGRPGKFQWGLICATIVSTYLFITIIVATLGIPALIGHIIAAVFSGASMVFALFTFASV